MAVKSSSGESCVASERVGDLRAVLREVGAEIRDRAGSFERYRLSQKSLASRFQVADPRKSVLESAATSLLEPEVVRTKARHRSDRSKPAVDG